jgi:hypothetical protein
MQGTRAVQVLCELFERRTNEIRATIGRYLRRAKPRRVSENEVPRFVFETKDRRYEKQEGPPVRRDRGFASALAYAAAATVSTSMRYSGLIWPSTTMSIRAGRMLPRYSAGTFTDLATSSRLGANFRECSRSLDRAVQIRTTWMKLSVRPVSRIRPIATLASAFTRATAYSWMPRAGTRPNPDFRTTIAATMHSTTDILSTLNGVSDGLDVRGRSATSLCTEAACNISLQVDGSEGVTPGSTINEVHVISLRG